MGGQQWRPQLALTAASTSLPSLGGLLALDGRRHNPQAAPCALPTLLSPRIWKEAKAVDWDGPPPRRSSGEIGFLSRYAIEQRGHAGMRIAGPRACLPRSHERINDQRPGDVAAAAAAAAIPHRLSHDGVISISQYIKGSGEGEDPPHLSDEPQARENCMPFV